MYASKGFAKPSKRPADKPAKVKEVVKRKQQSSEFQPLPTDGWQQLCQVSDFTPSKPSKAVELPGGKILVVYRHNGISYCSNAQSTAFKYPLVDGRVFDYEGLPAVETPLDGTVYDLQSGNVLKWCPQDNPLRAALGAFKKDTAPEPLRVYQTYTDSEGLIHAKVR